MLGERKGTELKCKSLVDYTRGARRLQLHVGSEIESAITRQTKLLLPQQPLSFRTGNRIAFEKSEYKTYYFVFTN